MSRRIALNPSVLSKLVSVYLGDYRRSTFAVKPFCLFLNVSKWWGVRDSIADSPLPLGHATIVAVRLLFEEWLERRHGVLSYRMTQVLTGHDKFGKFLCAAFLCLENGVRLE